MRKLFLSIIVALPLVASAQETVSVATEPVSAQAQPAVASAPRISIAVYSYEACWKAMPELPKVQAELDALHAQYTNEMQRVEADFNTKYEDFLEQQGKLANSIRTKRQSELQEILEKNLAFKKQARETLDNTERAKFATIKERLDQVIKKIAKNGNYTIVINIDNNNVPYFDEVNVTDITEAIIYNLK